MTSTRFFTTLALFAILCSCDRAQTDSGQAALPIQKLEGEAMGSYYRITHLGGELKDLETKVDSLLDAYNLELSAWVPESAISRYNRGETIDLTTLDHFQPNLTLARKIHQLTDGAYDPTVAPLVNYWGFGRGEARSSNEVDSAEVASIRELVGMEKLSADDGLLTPYAPGAQLDLNASAKGYGVDLLHVLLNTLKRPDHLIDIGGEMRAGGSKMGKPWRVAIRAPEEDISRISAIGTLPLADGRAIATSGNYLNFYRIDTVTYSHTINPKTGYVERSNLLSASVLADDCATADALATACMVLGAERGLELLEATEGVEGYFLVGEGVGELEVRKTEGLE